MTTYANVGHILLKRGNTIQSSSYTGPLGEITYDTDLGTVRVHNNVIPGGVNILATNAQIDTLTNSISVITGIDATFVANINTLLANAAVQSLAIGNLQAFQTYANATFGTSSYGNANVAAYLYNNDLVSNANVTVTGNITLSGILSSPVQTKTSTSTGTAGQVCWDANYIYVCTATNTWKRVALTGGVF